MAFFTSKQQRFEYKSRILIQNIPHQKNKVFQSRGGQLFWLRETHQRQTRYSRAVTFPYKLILILLYGKADVFLMFNICIANISFYKTLIQKNFKCSSRVRLRSLVGRMWHAVRTSPPRPALQMPLNDVIFEIFHVKRCYFSYYL